MLSGCIGPGGGAAAALFDVFCAVLVGFSDDGVIGIDKLTLSMVAELKSHALPLACAETVMGMTHHSKQWDYGSVGLVGLVFGPSRLIM